MLSIIICSRTKSISNDLVNNINQTIGIEHELVVIDNSNNEYSIFEAYNIGLTQSKNQLICFLHDDIHFITQNWGKIVVEIFQKNKDIGLIGIAGAKSKTKMPSAWWDCANEDLYMNIYQHLRDGRKEHWYKGFTNNALEDVVAIDGVFMAARKDNSIIFNTKLSGFHNYDLNFSFEYLKNRYRVVVTKEILLEHLSIGILNESWYKSTLQIHELYRNFLPLNKSNYDSSKKYEFINGARFLDHLLKLKLKKQAFYLWIKLFKIKPASKFQFKFFKSLFQ
ncbi:glycosyltransferase family protein [Flavobacterium sp. 17A]|uniref:Glycosyltransferase family protein n=1 Tax=Flavobacterium potami TaxID=2872310 RepID=A0A9X1KR42_9FLAO|nr:glycosyltransferase [Flavobacterium potami]MBZ4036563.1 glycosyltransferase family protein [Flavobacterium potami]